jgi:hypothetical protein
MRKFLIVAFVAGFLFSYVLFGPGRGSVSIAAALGGAIFFTFVGGIIARMSAPRYGAVAIGLTAAFAVIGHFG